MDHSNKMGSSLADLTDDLLVEIFSRLPVKSVCRSKCVSRYWHGLISHRAHRKKLPQTLSGFFSRHISQGDGPRFDSILGVQERHVSDPSLSFLPGYRTVRPVDCCNGLLLCLCSKDSTSNERNYVVCNPATEKWLILPDSGRHNEVFARRLCFDPAISSRFHVFSILEDVDDCITDVEIYSSEAGEWSHKENGWSQEIMLYDRSVFLNGMLYFKSYDSAVVTVDKEGKTWKTIPLLETMAVEISLVSNEALIGQSQGRLHYVNARDRDASTLSVWILDSHHSGKWIFKYNISTSKLFGHKGFRLSRNYTLIAIHPDCNLIFIILNGKNLLLSYDMDRGKVRVIHNLKDPFDERYNPYLPYVPLFT
ncbi:F-box protein At5g07610-like [Lolium rigidum]|uniref:F-box protein At5g07610-like n=1 Tax=Lolium rigidum TaxID=89674 RepID=UPI001F5C9DBF|nr:F-box protein At5g07610-like [Lolium rigidum]